MLIWLPPSEGKNAPAPGPSVGVALSRADRGPSPGRDALVALGTGPTLLPSSRSAHASTCPSTTASIPPPAPRPRRCLRACSSRRSRRSRRTRGNTRHVSRVDFLGTLWGPLPCDLVPDHRLAMGVSLPDFGVLSTWWAPRSTRLWPGGIGVHRYRCALGTLSRRLQGAVGARVGTASRARGGRHTLRYFPRR